jgi:hypothetical protein
MQSGTLLAGSANCNNSDIGDLPVLQFSYIQEVDFSKGVDQYNNASAVLPGFCEDILNMDISGMSLEKRSGFEKFAGDVPIPVTSISVNSGTATLTFPSYVNLDEISDTSPLWIYGRMTTDGGTTFVDIDFRADSFAKLSTYTLVTAGTPLSFNLATDLGLTSHENLIQTIDATTGEVIYITDFTVNPSTNAVSVTYTVSDNLDVQFVTGECTDTYSSPDYGEASVLTMDSPVTVTAATHGLSNQLIPMFWEMTSATDYKIVWPNEFTIQVNGDVDITFEGGTAGREFKLFLTSCTDYVEDTAVPGSSSTSKIIAGAATSYLLAACYVEDIGTGAYTLVLPDTITYDSAQNQHTVTFTHSEASELSNYKIVYTYGNVAANRLTVTGLEDTTGTTVDTGSASYSQTALAVTGFNNESMSTKPAVNFIDKYEALDETIIASGGQLFRSFDPSISESFDTRVRLSSDTVVGPSFAQANYGRTGGTIVTSSATAAGLLPAVSILWQSGDTYRLTIRATSYSPESYTGGLSSLSAIITTNSIVTISGSMKADLNGDFEVISTGTVDVDSFYIDVDVPSNQAARSNDAESGALVGIFSDTLQFQTDALFAADDVITLSSTVDCEVIGVDPGVSTRAYVKSVDGVVELFAGQRLGATAMKGSVVVPGSSELVAGDIVTVADVTTRVSSVTVGVSSTEIQFRDDVQVLSGQISISCPYRWQLILTSDTFLGTAPVSSTDLLRSVAGKSSLYLSSGVKYDGDKVYSSGLPNLQMHTAIGINESETSLLPVTSKIVAYTAVSGNTITVSASGATAFEVGDQVLIRATSGGTTICDATKIYTIIGKVNSSPTYTYTLDNPPPTPGATTYEIASFYTYRYFMRLALLDRNGNLVVSASTGREDLQVRLTKSAGVLLSGNVYPSDIDPIDYENLTVEIFRRREHRRDAARTDSEVNISNYYRLVSIPLVDESGYFQFVDAVSDQVAETSSNLDKIADPIPGGIGENRSRLPRSASFLTAINNQLVAGDYLGENTASIRVTGSALYSAFQTKEFNVEILNNSGTGTTYDYYVCEFGDRQGASVTSISAGTSFTVTVTSTAGMTAGDWVLITRNATTSLKVRPTFVGWHKITSVPGGGTTLVINWAGAPASVATEDNTGLQLFWRDGKIPLVDDLVYAPLSASTERDSSITAGLSLHLSQAITSTLLEFGVVAFGGKDRFEYAVTMAGTRLIDVTVPTVAGATIFCNGRQTSTNTALASTTRYGSRVALSVKGYPEVFDSLEDSVVNDLPQVQDVNPDDGERVRMAVPFFAASAFGAAQQSNVLIIFKDHSVYLLDPQAKYIGASDVFKQIDTSGYGCECPLSVLNSQLGVFFVNTTGVYMINRQFQLNRIGTALSGYLRDIFTPDSSTCSVNDIVGEKLMFTSGDSTMVMHLPENETGGIAWTRYTGLPAVMWAHRDNSYVFATASGYVGIASDRYADAGAAIETAVIFRYIDAGFPTLKKVLRHLSMILSSEVTYEKGDIVAEMATDFSNVYARMDDMKLTGNVNVILDGLSDLTRPSLQVTAFSPATVKAGWYQLKVTTEKLDAGLTIARVIYQIAPIRTRADVQAAET